MKIKLFKRSLLGAAILLGLVAVPAKAITVSPGDTIKVDNFSGISIYPYLADGLLFGVFPSTLTFDYAVYNGVAASPVTTGIYSGSFVVSSFTLQNSTAYVLLANFNEIGDMFGGLYAPEVCEGREGSCTPVRVGQFTQVNAVPIPAALPLLAAGLGAMGFMGWRKKRKAIA